MRRPASARRSVEMPQPVELSDALAGIDVARRGRRFSHDVANGYLYL
jgi:hypothetical protein